MVVSVIRYVDTETSSILRILQLYDFVTDEMQQNCIKTFVPFYVDDNKKNISITHILMRNIYLLLLCVVFGLTSVDSRPT